MKKYKYVMVNNLTYLKTDENGNIINFGNVDTCGSFGHGMILLGNTLNVSGHSLDWPGKVMGLQSYGVIDYSFLKELQITKAFLAMILLRKTER